MFLRRLIGHVRSLHWTMIIVDFVIVVLGVFIGLQAQQWSAARSEQQRADTLFQQLLGDLDSEKNSLDATKEYYETAKAYGMVALQGLNAPDTVDPETFVVSAYQATQVIDPTSSRSTFEEMLATGAIALIRTAETRSRLIGYYEFDWTKAPEFASQPVYREKVRSILPVAAQEAIKASCGDRQQRAGRTIFIHLPKTCHIDVPAAEIARAAAALRAEPALLPELRYQLSVIDTKIGNVVAVEQQLDGVIAAAKKVAP